MAASGAQIAALAARHRALLRRVRFAGVFARPSGVECAAPHALAWRRTGAATLQLAFSTDASKDKNTARPSLVISEAFGDGDDTHETDGDDELSFGLDLDSDDGEIPEGALDEQEANESGMALSTEDQRELARRLRYAMDRKKQWMQRLASDGASDTLLKVVYECYEPLYASHPALQHTPCAPWQAYDDAVAAADAETKYKPKWYDDQVTKITEQEAAALFVQLARPELAMAVFRHREWLATELGTVTVSRGDNVLTDDVQVDFSKHFRSFYSWAMGASAALSDHAQVFAIYENALENGVFPTANMTLAYLNSLIAKREFEAVAALFEQIQKDDRPTNLYFYRQMLFFSRLTGDAKTMESILKEMKIKGFKVRSEDYLNAIRSLDTQYYLSTGKKSAGTPGFNVADETYGECVARVADQEASPDKYAQREKASGSVIKLFEEMVEDEQLVPHSDEFFPRVIAAALLLHDYDRVAEYAVLHERCFKKPLADGGAVAMSVNALLLKDEPVAAWELVLNAHATTSGERKHKKRTQHRGPETTNALAATGNIVEYLVSHHELALALQLLEILDSKKLVMRALTPALSHMLLNAFVRDTDAVKNEQLWEMVSTKFWMAFPVSTHTKTLTQFVDMCITVDRWWVISKVLHRRDRSKIPTLPARIALRLSTKGLENPADAERVETVAHLAKMVDIKAMSAEARLAFCCNVVRALHLLRHDSSRGLHRQREISRIHDQFLRGKGVTVPQDVREILMLNAA